MDASAGPARPSVAPAWTSLYSRSGGTPPGPRGPGAPARARAAVSGRGARGARGGRAGLDLAVLEVGGHAAGAGGPGRTVTGPADVLGHGGAGGGAAGVGGTHDAGGREAEPGLALDDLDPPAFERGSARQQKGALQAAHAVALGEGGAAGEQAG